VHYVSRGYDWMQKHKFSVRSPNALFMETIQVPPKHERYCIDVSRPGCDTKHYVTYRSHRMQKRKFGVLCPIVHFLDPYRMQKYKFGVTCPITTFRESVPVTPEHEK
jgi:hypothetical protein